MFDSIGSKIKSAASIVFWLGFIVSVLLGIYIIFNDGRDHQWLIGILFIIISSSISYFYSLMFYGFGQLIENTEELLQVKKILIAQRTDELKKMETEGLITREEYYNKIRDLD